jgi:TolB-like protein
MKKFLIIAFIALLGSACGSSPKSGPDQLDLTIRETSDYLNGSITKGNKLAILNIQSSYPALSEYIIDELIANTVNDKIFSVVDRQQLDTIREEQNFQMSGEVDDNSAQKLGALLGAQTIITGAVSKVGDMYRLRVRALNVESAQIEGQFNRNIQNSPVVNNLVQSLPTGGRTATTAQTRPAVTAAATAPAATPPAPAAPAPAPAQPAVRTYSVGDTGPAGGIIFYDKRNNSGGWRYLEAAPVEAEFQAQWSVRGTRVDNTQETIGSGRRNTQLIVETFSQTSGEWDTAAQKCADLSFGGFNDWFLPSKAELDQMYGNLKRRNLGDFKNEWYWSSTVMSLQSFQSGQISTEYSSGTSRRYVRPIRQVAGPN